MGEYEEAVAAFRNASERAPLDALDKLWMAETLLRTQHYEEVLATLDGVSDLEAKVLRAHAFAQLGRGAEMIDLLQGMENEHANNLCMQCLDRLFAAGHDATVAARWLLARESTDPIVLTRQASGLAAHASATKNPNDIQRATEWLSKARQAGAPEAELVLSEILLAMATDRQDIAVEATARIDPSAHPDMIAMLATTAFSKDMLELASTLADRALRSEQKPIHFPLEIIAIERLLVAFRLGQSRETMKLALGRTPLPSSIWGRLAEAVVRYLDGEVRESIEILRPLLSGRIVPVQSILLLCQCLAEAHRYQELQKLCEVELPKLASLAEWAAKRCPKRDVTATEKVAAAAASFMNSREFIGIPENGPIVRVSSGEDWASALSGVKASAPNATAVWVVRIAEPTAFIRTLFNLKAPS